MRAHSESERSLWYVFFTGVDGEARGYDGGKKIRGRKRHLLVDTEELVLKARVHSAKIPDQDGIKLVLEATRDRLPRLSHLWVTPYTICC
jgi:putative transposase